MLEVDDKPLIFIAIEAQDLEQIEAILQEEGTAAILTRYQGETAIDHVFHLLDNADSFEAVTNGITITCRLLEFYHQTCQSGTMLQDQQLDLQHHLGRAIEHAAHSRNSDHYHPLIVAVLEAGARINEILPEQSYTALSKAILAHDRKLVALLLENGANPEATNLDDESCIALAMDKRATRILWDMLVYLRLHWLEPDIVDILASGFQNRIKDMLDEGRLAAQDVLLIAGVALLLSDGQTPYTLLRHYLAVAPKTKNTRDKVYRKLLYGLIRCQDENVFIRLYEFGLFDDARAEELLPQLIEEDNDVLAAALINSPFHSIVIIASDADTPLSYCPTFTDACLYGMTKTVTAFISAGFLTTDMVTHAITEMIKEGAHSQLSSLLVRFPPDPRTSLELLRNAVAYDNSYCLSELIEAGANPSLDLENVLNNDDLITADNFANFLLSLSCAPPEREYHPPIFRFACTLILLEATAGPVDRLNRLCDFIIIDACQDEDPDAVVLLTRVGMSPEALLQKFVTDYHDPNIAANDQDILAAGATAACNGIILYLDTLLALNNHQLILEGCMGLFRIDEPPALPLNIRLINVLCEIADNPDNFPPTTVWAIKRVVKSIIALFKRLSEPKTLSEISSETFLAINPDDIEDTIDTYFGTFSMIFGNFIWTELLYRHDGVTRRHYQLLARQLLLNLEGTSDYYPPN